MHIKEWATILEEHDILLNTSTNTLTYRPKKLTYKYLGWVTTTDNKNVIKVYLENDCHEFKPLFLTLCTIYDTAFLMFTKISQ